MKIAGGDRDLPSTPHQFSPELQVPRAPAHVACDREMIHPEQAARRAKRRLYGLAPELNRNGAHALSLSSNGIPWSSSTGFHGPYVVARIRRRISSRLISGVIRPSASNS